MVSETAVGWEEEKKELTKEGAWVTDEKYNFYFSKLTDNPH